jgi:hypothetical protein
MTNFSDVIEAIVKEAEQLQNKGLCVHKPSFNECLIPGFIIDMTVGDRLVHAVILNNKTLLMIDPEDHKVMGYLNNYTDITPYVINKIRKPVSTAYKYSDDSMPVVWEKDHKVEMSIADIEKALGIKSGTLTIK